MILLQVGVLVIIFSMLVFIHPGMTVVTLVYIMGITLIIVGIEKIISGIFERHGSKWGTVGLEFWLHLRFFSRGISYNHRSLRDSYVGCWSAICWHLSSCIRIWEKGSPAWARGFSIGAGALAVILSFLVEGSLTRGHWQFLSLWE